MEDNDEPSGDESSDKDDFAQHDKESKGKAKEDKHSPHKGSDGHSEKVNPFARGATSSRVVVDQEDGKQGADNNVDEDGEDDGSNQEGEGGMSIAERYIRIIYSLGRPRTNVESRMVAGGLIAGSIHAHK